MMEIEGGGEAYGSLVLMEDILTYSFCKTLKNNTGIEKLITLESRLGMNNHHKSIDYLLSLLFLFNYYSLFYYSIMGNGITGCVCVCVCTPWEDSRPDFGC